MIATPARICTQRVMGVDASTEIPVVPTPTPTPTWLNISPGSPALAASDVTATATAIKNFFIEEIVVFPQAGNLPKESRLQLNEL